jgi:transcriptional regulator
VGENALPGFRLRQTAAPDPGRRPITKRRDLLAGLTAAGIDMAAAEPPSGSLYIPKPHLVEDRDLLHDFMDEFSFVELITASPEIRITHVPVLLDRASGRYGTVSGHIARQNPQGDLLDGRHSAVLVFRGPDGYVSPAWYARAAGVPTWNFAVVHATGNLRAITETKALRDLLAKLVARYESRERTGYDFAGLPDSYVSGLAGGAMGFEMEITRLEGKFKLGQERSPADREGLLRNLGSARAPRGLRDFTAAFHERVKSRP